jgi:ElaB/YqjD/DUF883 family membrane-anchored ribosome-binding protein
MAQEGARNLSEIAATEANRMSMAVRDVADRAGGYAQRQVTLMSERAKALATAANELVEEYTGRTAEAWTTDIRSYVRTHPLQIVLATIGVGYVLGKIIKR